MGFFKKLFRKEPSLDYKDSSEYKQKPELNEVKEPPPVKEISVDELKKKMNNKEDFTLIDIRTEPELGFGTIKHKQKFIPMHLIPTKLSELDKEKETILYCRVGNRTYNTAQYMMQQGFKNVSSLAGGIIAWKKFDDSITLY